MRKLTDDEMRLLSFLIDRSSLDVCYPILCKTMNDGGMGSITLFPGGKALDYPRRKFGKIVSECEFYDTDGVFVSAVLIVDDNHELFELDVWKVDFSPLIAIPDSFE